MSRIFCAEQQNEDYPRQFIVVWKSSAGLSPFADGLRPIIWRTVQSLRKDAENTYGMARQPRCAMPEPATSEACSYFPKEKSCGV
jgi:hypothetical protein